MPKRQDFARNVNGFEIDVAPSAKRQLDRLGPGEVEAIQRRLGMILAVANAVPLPEQPRPTLFADLFFTVNDLVVRYTVDTASHTLFLLGIARDIAA